MKIFPAPGHRGRTDRLGKVKTMTNFVKRTSALTGALLLMSGAAMADQVIADDLIVQGSICVGTDCVNGESFGFDTLRLKENNLRIKAQDTSASASFPTVDWQLTFNDSANGGANKFSIDNIDRGTTPFTILDGAPSNSLYVDAQGDVGVGTSNAVVELHVVDGDSPTLRLEQNGSSGFTPQTWDIASNETNFFVRDVTNGSQLPLRIRPGADSNALYIDADNNVGLGTASPDDKLDLEGPSSVAIRMSAGGAAFPVRLNHNANNNEFRITFDGAPGASAFKLDNTGGLTLAGGIVTGSTCIQMDTLACTFSAGSGASCAVATCP